MRTKNKTAKYLSFVPTPVGVAAPPVSTTLPTPPSGWVAPKKVGYQVRNALAAQKRAATEAAQQIASAKNFATIFGSGAPDALDLANALGTAGAWSGDVTQVRGWIAWGRENEGRAWSRAFGLLDPFQAVFEAAVARDPRIATQFPAVAEYFKASRDQGARSAAGRKAKKGGTQAPSAPAVTSPSAPATATANAGGTSPTKA